MRHPLLEAEAVCDQPSILRLADQNLGADAVIIFEFLAGFPGFIGVQDIDIGGADLGD